MKVLITGMAGFIGYHLARHFLKAGYEVYGLDNLCNSYDLQLKLDRLKALGFRSQNIVDYKILDSDHYKNLKFVKMDLEEKSRLEKLFEEGFDYVVNLAAYTGVRDSIDNPDVYIKSNLVGFANIIEVSAKNNVRHFLYASSSSVYGYTNEEVFTEDMVCEYPLTLYGATKKSNELIAHSYSNVFDIPVTGLRFFNVYGPFGRPDMAPFLFTDAIYTGKTLNLFNAGDMYRDLVHVDDISASIVKLTSIPPEKNESNDLSGSTVAKYRIVNIGNSETIKIIDFVHMIEDIIGKKANINLMPMQIGEAYRTCASTEKLASLTGFKPYTDLKEGMKEYIEWYKEYYHG